MSSSSSSTPPLSTFEPPLKKEEPRNWAEFLSELMSSILLRLSVVEILDNAQKVCRRWRQVCKDPFMWRKIDMTNLGNHGNLNLASMCRHAVHLSQGGLVEIHTGNFVDNNLLGYIAHRSRNLRSLGLASPRSTTRSEGIVNAIAKLPLLETIEVSSRLCLRLNLKAIGHACPQLKTLKINNTSYMPVGMRALRHLQNLSKRVNDYPFHMTFVDDLDN